MTPDQREQIAEQLSRSMLNIISELETMNEAILAIQRPAEVQSTN